MWKINEEISKFANEVMKYIWPVDATKVHETNIQNSMKNYGIKSFNFEVMDKDLPTPNGKVTTYRLKTVTLDGLMHFYVVAWGSMGAFAMDEYDLIAQGWSRKKIRIEPQYEITYGDGTKQDLFMLR